MSVGSSLVLQSLRASSSFAVSSLLSDLIACSEFAIFSSGLRVSLCWRFLLKRHGSSRVLQFWRAFPISGVL